MWRTNHFGTWVVYRMTFRTQDAPVNAVCEQGEWAAMEAAHPGRLVLIRSGITSEGEAERLARGMSGDPVPRGVRPPAKRPAVAAAAAPG
ncbi:MAG: hypothetical protein K2X87_11890 [Gemmataceae bacterium]|nr:hypothetical protein [Gemmataceae bacterium]